MDRNITKETLVVDAELSARLLNICNRLNIKTIEELLKIPKREMARIRNVGKTTLFEINNIRQTIEGNVANTSFNVSYSELYDMLRNERLEAISSQWREASVDIPAMNGDNSDIVIVRTETDRIIIATYNRYEGWSVENVKYWMPIPKVK